jgi:hypothetical protein
MRSRLLAVAGAGLAALATAATAGAGEQGSAAQGGCQPKTNVEAIVDDSQSMLFNDQNELRVRAMELFIDSPGNERRTLGAVEFGSDAASVFPPTRIGPNRQQLKSALNTAINGDNGATDYNAAFAVAGTHNPNATARIFLTDGAHTDEPPYANGHRGGPPVHVIGFGFVDEAVLQQIANETGGSYQLANTAGELQSAMVNLNSSIGCLAAPVTLRNNFTQSGQSANRSVRLPGGVRSVNTTLTWDDPANRFDITNIRVVRRGNTVARGSAVRKLRVKKRRGPTFVTVKVGRLVRGKLKFKLRARRIEEVALSGAAQLTTQVVRSRRR